MAEQWTIYVCTGCGGATGRHKDCDAVREAVDVVPVKRLRESERALREFQYGLTLALSDHGVPAMPSWREAIDYLAAHGGS